MRLTQIIIVVALCCAQSLSLYSQSFFDGVASGLKGGIVSTYIGGDVPTYSIGRLMAGGVLITPVAEDFDLKIEALFVWQGAGDANRRGDNGRWQYTYLNFPVLVNLHPFDNDNIRLDAGLQPGFLLDAWYTDEDRKFNLDSETRNFDMSLLLGAAYHFNPNWMIDLRFTLSLIDHSLRTWTGDRYLNRTLQIGVGYLFGLGL